MADVIKIAKERRTRLASELAKLDDFIRMAEALVEWSESKADKSAEGEDEASDESKDSPTIRPYPAAAAAGAGGKK